MGKKAKETVTQRFLLTHLLEKYLDLFNSFETIYRFDLRNKKRRAGATLCGNRSLLTEKHKMAGKVAGVRLMDKIITWG